MTLKSACVVACIKRWGRLKRSAIIWAFGRTRDTYFEILGAPRGIMVTRCGGFEF